MDVSQGLASSKIENKFLRIFLNLLKLNHHEKHPQHTKYSLLWGSLDYEWFTRGHQDFSNKTMGSLGLNGDRGRIMMALGLEQRLLGSSIMEDNLKHHIVHHFYGIFGL